MFTMKNILNLKHNHIPNIKMKFYCRVCSKVFSNLKSRIEAQDSIQAFEMKKLHLPAKQINIIRI